MGYHMSLVGFKKIPKIIKPGEFSISERDFYDHRLMYGTDCDMGPGRSPFHDAMFRVKDICFLQIYEKDKPSEQEDFRIVGCLSSSDIVLRNFINWSESKSNPFSKLFYYDDAVTAFIRRIDEVRYAYKYLFWDSSVLYNVYTSNERKILSFMKQSCSFYDTVRDGKKASLEETKAAVKWTPFVVKDSRVKYIDWLPKDEVKENADNGLYFFYGDI